MCLEADRVTPVRTAGSVLAEANPVAERAVDLQLLAPALLNNIRASVAVELALQFVPEQFDAFHGHEYRRARAGIAVMFGKVQLQAGEFALAMSHPPMTSYASQNHPVSAGTRSEGKKQRPRVCPWTVAQRGNAHTPTPAVAAPTLYPRSGPLMHVRRIPAVIFLCLARQMDRTRARQWLAVARYGTPRKDTHPADRIDWRRFPTPQSTG